MKPALVIVLALLWTTASAEPLTNPGLEARLSAISSEADGELGICAIPGSGVATCTNGDRRFSLQSVMKLIVGAAVLDAADQGHLRLDDPITIHRRDLSLNVQPLADLVRARGELTTTFDDLVFRAVTQSDSAASDILMRRLGGSAAIQAFLDRKGLGDGIRVDRDERHLQTEAAGLSWRPEFVDPGALDKALSELTPEERDKAFQAYLTDPRDTATPRAMARFLRRLVDGRLLSPQSTQRLLEIMRQTRTFPGRLRAGMPPGWAIGHKTGTSDTRNGLNGVSNDVGVMTRPDGATIAVAAFYARSRSSEAERDAVIAACAKAITDELR